MIRLGLEERQSQTLKLTVQMRQSIRIMAMDAPALRDEILSEAEKNPALEISPPHHDFSSIHSSGRGADFQDFFENLQDSRETLQSRLLRQLGEISLEKDVREFAEKLIQNLDKSGFNIEPPETLFFGAEKPKPLSGGQKRILQAALELVRRLEPVGTAFSSSLESLRFQAECAGADKAVFAVLNALQNFHFSQVLTRKNLKKSLKKSEMLSEFSERQIESALDFVKKLNPRPASGIGEGENALAIPEVVASLCKNSDGDEALEVRLLDGFLPKVEISKEFAALADSPQCDDFAKKNLSGAKSFLMMIEGRKATLLKVASEICKAQIDFFKRGTPALKPLKLADIAQKCGVSESTVSRMTRGKFLQCDFGAVELKSFFSPPAQKPGAKTGENPMSKAAVKKILSDIIEKSRKEGKRHSDSALAAVLRERGAKISRRTVAKYRAELFLPSSLHS